jgi:hypothetical protein
MSQYGLIVGDDYNIQFDTTRKVLGLWAHDFATSWTLFNPGRPGGYYHSVSYACQITGVPFKAINNGPVYTDARNIYQSYECGGDNVEYAVYSPDTNNSSSLPAWGLVTYNAQGDIVFNSSVRYMKIRSIIEVARSGFVDNPLDISDYSITITHSGIYNPFYLIPYNYGIITWYDGIGFGGLFVRLGIQRISDTSSKIGWFTVRSTPPLGGSPLPNKIYVPNPLNIAICEL